MRWLTFLFTVFCLPQFALAGFFYRVESGNFQSDGINPTSGSVNVYLFTDNPTVDLAAVPLVDSFTVSLAVDSFTGSISSVDFPSLGAIGAPTGIYSTPLFATSPIVLTNDFQAGFERLIVSSNFGEANRPTFNNAGLFTVNFTVPTNQIGTFRIVPTNSDGFFSDLDPDGVAAPFTPTLQGGTITITAVPEPGSMVLLAVGGTLVGYVSRRRRRRV